jgi:hypothetical protein
MKRLLGSLVVTAPALALLASTGTATAQLDPLPNVLLLVDTSGSMEYRTGFYVDPSNANVEVEPYCNPNLNTPQGPRTCATEEVISGQTCAMYERSRWIDLVEVLTGELRDFRCEAIDRENAVPGDRFTNLYRLNGLLPYDVGYGSPFHRLLVRTTDASGLVTTGFCAPGPAVPNPTVGPLTLASGLPSTRSPGTPSSSTEPTSTIRTAWTSTPTTGRSPRRWRSTSAAACSTPTPIRSASADDLRHPARTGDG